MTHMKVMYSKLLTINLGEILPDPTPFYGHKYPSGEVLC